MGTIKQMYENWCLEELRGESQVNKEVWLAWFNKGLLQFQKAILEYVSGKHSTSVAYSDIYADQDEYSLPSFSSLEHVEDFYSIVQLRVAYHTNKAGNPIYRVCKPIDFGDYNIAPALNTYKKHVLIDPSGEYVPSNFLKEDGKYVYEYVNEQDWDAEGKPMYKLCGRWGVQRWKPIIRDRISEVNPRYIFVPHLDTETGKYSNSIKIFPTPLKDVERGLTLTYNFVQQPLTVDEVFGTHPIDIETLNLPWYFMDAIDDYITFRLYQAENPEMAQWYYQQFENILHDNIYGLNKDKRPVEEWLANTSYFSHY